MANKLHSSGELVLTAVHPGVTVEQVKVNTGWGLRLAESLSVTRLPTEDDLRILFEFDPQKTIYNRSQQ